MRRGNSLATGQWTQRAFIYPPAIGIDRRVHLQSSEVDLPLAWHHAQDQAHYAILRMQLIFVASDYALLATDRFV